MRLHVESGSLAGTSVELDRTQPTSIGSSADCTLHLPEPGIAANHAVVKALREDGFGIKALAKGVRVNGSEIEAAPLQEGDTIELGTARLVYGSRKRAASKGPQIKGFQVLRELGRGGMGMVYLAEQTSLNRQVALKVLDDKRTSDPGFVANFVAEARAAAKLSHPNVVHVFDVDQDAGTYYYAMELMHHGSLEDWLKKNGKMPVERALQVIADAASGLAYAESLRIVHRDIKPDNLMLDQHGTVKIADLGLAFTDENQEEQAAGTPHFMAPEQVLRKALDHRTDLYALGCTFYRLVTGKTPFKGQAVKDILRAQVKDEAEPAHKVDPSVPQEVSVIIQKLMQKEPGDRFQSATELLDEVTTLLSPPAKKGLWIGLAAAAVLLASGAIYWAVTKPKDVIKETEYIDNPEAARLAGVNKQLEAAAREAEATIALLRARLDAGAGEALASALDAVAAAHKGTAAAAQASELAAATRRELAAFAAKTERAVAEAENALAALQKDVDVAVAKNDLPAALVLLEGKKPAQQADATTFEAGLQRLRSRVVEAAATHVAALRAEIERARGEKQAEALRTAARALAAISADTGWNQELLPARTMLASVASAAVTEADQLEQDVTKAQWRTFAELLHQEKGMLDDVARGNFTEAAAAIEAHAVMCKDLPMGQRSQRLQSSLVHAAAFAGAIDRALPQGEVQLHLDGQETNLVVTAWHRGEGQIVLSDTSKKPPKETVLPTKDLSLELWESLCLQVDEPADKAGSRACMLAWIAIERHQHAAKTYLQNVKLQQDDSGTGADGYPLGVTAFDVLLQQLPDGAAWAAGVREEVIASRALAAGLRALSERRNLAAANYLDRLLADHPHSVCVTGMP
ncbi:MAG: FHA domain-containing serine/threonine-protein kinase [Planctomycetota bacterium]